MKIFETIHDRKQYFLVFDNNNDVIGKFETKEEAINEVQRHNTISQTEGGNK